MVTSLKHAEPLTAGYRRIATECLDTALAALDTGGDRDAAVHTVRKQCKQLRALIRLFHTSAAPERRMECRCFRDLGRSLSALRDARVALDVHGKLIERYRAVLDPCAGELVREGLSADLEQKRTAILAAVGDSLPQQLLAARQRARRLEAGDEAEKVLQRAFVRSYRRARRAAGAAAEYGHVEDFHEARKRSKDHWYQLEFLSQRWPHVTAPRIDTTRRLTEVLGDAQDWAVYRAAIERVANPASTTAAALLSAVAASEERKLQAEALELFPRVFDVKPKRLADSIGEPDTLHRAVG